MKTIAILGTGGTIAGQSANLADTLSYQSGCLGLEQLLQSLPGLQNTVTLQPEDLLAIGSEEMTPAHWLQIAQRVQQLADDPQVDGIVITHGTDTLEETAYFLQLTLKTSKPVVMVGAMRPASALSADGPMNLYQGILTAATPEASGRGVLMVLNDTIFCAREVQKIESLRPNAFGGGQYGVLGCFRGGQAVFWQNPSRRHTQATPFTIRQLTELPALPAVGICYLHAGFDTQQLTLAQQLGWEGAVLAAFGNGTMDAATKKAVAQAADRGLTIVVASRCAWGTALNAVPGTVSAGDLSPQKARILLQLALTQPQSLVEIQKIFQRY